MVKAGRNQPCPCGSGHKTKRCCGERHGPSEESLARAFLAVHEHEALQMVITWDRTQFLEVFDEMLDLPERDLSLLVPLPAVLTLELQRLGQVVTDEDDEEIDEAVEAVLPRFDTPLVRAHLARAVVAARDAGRVGREVTAMALVNLASRSLALIRSSLLEAAAVAFGAVETPSGILVARR